MEADVSYPLPPPVAKVLITMVEVAERNQVLTVYISCSFGGEGVGRRYVISAGSDNEILSGLEGDPITSLRLLGLVERPDNNHVFLHPTAFQRARYERMSCFGKWWARTAQKDRDIILGVTTGLAILLTILQVLEILGVF